MLIKRIDIANHKTILAFLGKFPQESKTQENEDEPESVPSEPEELKAISTLNKKHIFYEIYTMTFPDDTAQKKLPK